MSKNRGFSVGLIALLALGIILPITNPSEAKHKEAHYAALKKSDKPLDKFVHVGGKISDAISGFFGTRSIFVYDNYLFFSVLKIDTDGVVNGNETPLSVGILGNVFHFKNLEN